jgi:hypothetical protein
MNTTQPQSGFFDNVSVYLMTVMPREEKENGRSEGVSWKA